MEDTIVQSAYIKLDIALQNIRYLAPRVSSNLNRDKLTLDPVKYLGNPLGYIADIIGGPYWVVGVIYEWLPVFGIYIITFIFNQGNQHTHVE